MTTDYQNLNFFKAAARAYMVNIWTALGVAVLLLLLEWLTLVFDNAFGKYIAPIMIGAYFAYTIHATILYGFTSGMSALKKDKNSQKFIWRSFIFYGGLVLIMALVFLLTYMIVGKGGSKEIFVGWAVVIFVVVGLPLFGASFAFWGTILPATVAGADASLPAAWQRAKGHIWYTFSRLVIGPFLVALVSLVGFGLFDHKFGPFDIVAENGAPSPVGILLYLAAQMGSLFATALAASVLRKTYLRGESTAPAP